MNIRFIKLNWQTWNAGARAETPFGYYNVCGPQSPGYGDGASYMWVPGRQAAQSSHDTMDEAKDAAQKDFNRRAGLCLEQMVMKDDEGTAEGKPYLSRPLTTAAGDEVSVAQLDEAFSQFKGHEKDLPVSVQIRLLRSQSGLSQEGLAKAIGATQGSLSKWESGQEMPGAEAFLRINKVCSK